MRCRLALVADRITLWWITERNSPTQSCHRSATNSLCVAFYPGTGIPGYRLPLLRNYKHHSNYKQGSAESRSDGMCRLTGIFDAIFSKNPTGLCNNLFVEHISLIKFNFMAF